MFIRDGLTFHVSGEVSINQIPVQANKITCCLQICTTDLWLTDPCFVIFFTVYDAYGQLEC